MKILQNGIKKLKEIGAYHLQNLQQIFEYASEERKNQIIEENKEAAEAAFSLSRDALNESLEAGAGAESVQFDTRTNELGEKTGKYPGDNYLLEITPDDVLLNRTLTTERTEEAIDNLALKIDEQRRIGNRGLMGLVMAQYNRLH